MDFFTTKDTELSEFHFFIFSLFCLYSSSICKNPFRYNFDSFWKTVVLYGMHTGKRHCVKAFGHVLHCIYKKYENNTNNKKNTKILERNTKKNNETKGNNNK
jgi:hypothetical protein